MCGYMNMHGRVRPRPQAMWRAWQGTAPRVPWTSVRLQTSPQRKQYDTAAAAAGQCAWGESESRPESAVACAGHHDDAATCPGGARCADVHGGRCVLRIGGVHSQQAGSGRRHDAWPRAAHHG